MKTTSEQNLLSLHTPFVHLAWTPTQINGPTQDRRKSSLSLWASTQNMKQSVSSLPVHHFEILPFPFVLISVLSMAYFMPFISHFLLLYKAILRRTPSVIISCKDYTASLYAMKMA